MHPVTVDVRARVTPRGERVVRRNELPEHEPRDTQTPERLADGRRVRVARLGDRVMVRGVGAWLLRQKEEQHSEVEMREGEPGNVTETEKQKREVFVVRARRRDGVRRVGLVECRRGGLRHEITRKTGTGPVDKTFTASSKSALER